MKSPVSVRRRRRVVLGVLLLPPVLWAAVLAVVPTAPARRCISQRLSAASGRPVELARVRVGFLGGVSLSGLRIGAPGSSQDPWLVLDDAHIDVSFFQLLFGQIEPTSVDVRGLNLRVLRRADGTLELADFLQPPPGAPSTEAPDSDSAEPAGLTIRVREASVDVIDEPTRTALKFREVEGRAVCRGRTVSVPALQGMLNGGRFELTAGLDRGPEGPAFEGQLYATGVSLAEGMDVLAYLVPVLAAGGDGARLDGRLDLECYVRGRGASRRDLARTLVGQGRVVLDPVRLDGSGVLDEVARVIDLPAQGRVGAVRASLTVKNGRFLTDDLTIDVAREPVVLAGWTDFDGRVDYRLRADRLVDRLPARAREFLADLSVDPSELADVRLKGTVGAVTLTVEGVPLAAQPSPRPGDDRQRLREFGRRFRDRIRR